MKLEALLSRKGARRRSEIPEDVLKALNQGKIESVNLVEWLAVDHLLLLKNTLKALGFDSTKQRNFLYRQCKSSIDLGIVAKYQQLGTALFTVLSDHPQGHEIYQRMSQHSSDTIRGLAAYADAANENLTFSKRLLRVKPFAIDQNSGVREIAWMSLRHAVGDQLIDQVRKLVPWTKKKNSNERRFVIELTRPCGVWCAHLNQLKQTPEICLPLLENCRSDVSKYVQDSVANWLNDASKSQAIWVKKFAKTGYLKAKRLKQRGLSAER